MGKRVHTQDLNRVRKRLESQVGTDRGSTPLTILSLSKDRAVRTVEALA